MMSHLSCRVGMGGIRESLDGKIWEWDLGFRWEWEWDENGNEVIEMGGNWYEKSVPTHLYYSTNATLYNLRNTAYTARIIGLVYPCRVIQGNVTTWTELPASDPMRKFTASWRNPTHRSLSSSLGTLAVWPTISSGNIRYYSILPQFVFISVCSQCKELNWTGPTGGLIVS